MRKKMLSLALALALCLGLTVPAIAADYTEAIPCQYARVGDFSEGLAAVAVQDGTYDSMRVDYNYRWGFIDKTGKEVIPCQYVGDNAYSKGSTSNSPRFSEGLAAVVIDDGTEYKVSNYRGKYCFIDKTGKEVIPAKYDTASNFSEGLAMVGVYSGRYQDILGTHYTFTCGFIDKTGKEVIPCQYHWAYDFSEGLAAVSVKSEQKDKFGNDTYDWGYIDQTGKMVISPQHYLSVSNFSDGLALVWNRDRKYGYIDKTGKEVIPCQYSYAGDFSEGLAPVYIGEMGNGGKKIFIDKTGKQAIPVEYDSTTNNTFSEGLAAVTGYGYIDKTGKVVISNPRNTLGDFSEGIAVVDGGWNYKGYIDKTGQEIVPRQYVAVSPVSEGMAAVATIASVDEKHNYTYKWGFISFDGSQPAAPAVPTVGGFTDVKTGDYFADPVLWAVEKNITQGTGNGQFSPGTTCNQGQILTFLWRAKGEPKPTGTVGGTQYYATAAQWAKDQGLTDNFSAEADCTRAMVVTYLWKLAGSPNAGTPDFTDVSANADFAQAVAWAVEQGITSGTGNGQFNPNGICNRGQIVTFLYRAFAK